MNPANKENGLNSAELRCGCGCLVARLLETGIELKCRRCKRLALIPFDGLKDGAELTVRI